MKTIFLLYCNLLNTGKPLIVLDLSLHLIDYLKNTLNKIRFN